MAGLYNPNNFQYGYQPPPFQMNNTPQQSSGIMWVQGEAGARAYPVAAGNSVLLLDSEASVFYIKTTDASGMPTPLRIFDFTERSQQAQATPVITNPENNFATKDDLRALKDEIEKRFNSNQLRRKERRNESVNEYSDRKQSNE